VRSDLDDFVKHLAFDVPPPPALVCAVLAVTSAECITTPVNSAVRPQLCKECGAVEPTSNFARAAHRACRVFRLRSVLVRESGGRAPPGRWTAVPLPSYSERSEKCATRDVAHRRGISNMHRAAIKAGFARFQGHRRKAKNYLAFAVLIAFTSFLQQQFPVLLPFQNKLESAHTREKTPRRRLSARKHMPSSSRPRFVPVLIKCT